MRSDVAETQRETLEIRLATEELWARLCGTMAPAALTQSLSQIRLKLAEQNRFVERDLAEQKSELHALSTRLAEQHEKLTRQKHELETWVQQRHEQIEQQAASLVAREQELDSQETAFSRREKAWQNERVGLQQEIRRLLRQLRQVDKVAA